MKKRKKKRCYSGIGGQAVLEGIMMKNKERYSLAVRKPDGVIHVETGGYAGILGESGIARAPFVRGMFSFVDSLILGTRCLNRSAFFYEEEEEKAGAAEGALMALTTAVAIAVAVGLFMVLPYFISEYLKGFVRNDSLLTILEGVIRISIFVAYVLLISLMKDIRRVYMYHGAEHKCINCIERGRPLTVENVMRSSKRHKRCGTSFLLFVMLVSMVVFFFIRVDNVALKVALRVLLIPVIAGISYEIIRLAGRSDNWLVRFISAPGMWLQELTTKEPDEDMAEVAIKAVEAVFDWRTYLQENFGYEAEAQDESEREMAAPVEEDMEEEEALAPAEEDTEEEGALAPAEEGREEEETSAPVEEEREEEKIAQPEAEPIEKQGESAGETEGGAGKEEEQGATIEGKPTEETKGTIAAAPGKKSGKKRRRVRR